MSYVEIIGSTGSFIATEQTTTEVNTSVYLVEGEVETFTVPLGTNVYGGGGGGGDDGYGRNGQHAIVIGSNGSVNILSNYGCLNGGGGGFAFSDPKIRSDGIAGGGGAGGHDSLGNNGGNGGSGRSDGDVGGVIGNVPGGKYPSGNGDSGNGGGGGGSFGGDGGNTNNGIGGGGGGGAGGGSGGDVVFLFVGGGGGSGGGSGTVSGDGGFGIVGVTGEPGGRIVTLNNQQGVGNVPPQIPLYITGNAPTNYKITINNLSYGQMFGAPDTTIAKYPLIGAAEMTFGIDPSSVISGGTSVYRAVLGNMDPRNTEGSGSLESLYEDMYQYSWKLTKAASNTYNNQSYGAQGNIWDLTVNSSNIQFISSISPSVIDPLTIPESGTFVTINGAFRGADYTVTLCPTGGRSTLNYPGTFINSSSIGFTVPSGIISGLYNVDVLGLIDDSVVYHSSKFNGLTISSLSTIIPSRINTTSVSSQGIVINVTGTGFTQGVSYVVNVSLSNVGGTNVVYSYTATLMPGNTNLTFTVTQENKPVDGVYNVNIQGTNNDDIVYSQNLYNAFTVITLPPQTITSVTPSTINNTFPETVTVQGTGFVDGAGYTAYLMPSQIEGMTGPIVAYSGTYLGENRMTFTPQGNQLLSRFYDLEVVGIDNGFTSYDATKINAINVNPINNVRPSVINTLAPVPVTINGPGISDASYQVILSSSGLNNIGCIGTYVGPVGSSVSNVKFTFPTGGTSGTYNVELKGMTGGELVYDQSKQAALTAAVQQIDTASPSSVNTATIGTSGQVVTVTGTNFVLGATYTANLTPSGQSGPIVVYTGEFINSSEINFTIPQNSELLSILYDLQIIGQVENDVVYNASLSNAINVNPITSLDPNNKNALLSFPATVNGPGILQASYQVVLTRQSDSLEILCDGTYVAGSGSTASNVTFTFPARSDNITGTYNIAMTGIAGENVVYNQSKQSVLQVCNVPTNLTQTSVKSSSVTLQWIGVNDATSYLIEYTGNGSTSSTTYSNASGAVSMSYTVTGLSASTTYSFKVAGKTDNTIGPYSSPPLNVTTSSMQEITNVSPRTINTATIGTSGQVVTVTGTNFVLGATYTANLTPSGQPGPIVVYTGEFINSSEINFTIPQNSELLSTVYDLQIIGQVEADVVYNASFINALNVNPTITSLDPNNKNSLLSFLVTVNGSGIIQALYQVVLTRQSDRLQIVCDGTYVADSGSTASKVTFTFPARSVNITGTYNMVMTGIAEGSVVYNQSKTSALQVCNVPTNLTCDDINNNSIDINWIGVNDATSYLIEYTGNGSTSSTTYSNASGAVSMSYTVTGLLKYTTYSFKVAGKTDNTIGPYSNTVSGKTTCILEGTLIETIDGYKRIETLRKGDLVKTLKDGYLPITTIGKKKIYHENNEEKHPNKLYCLRKKDFPSLFDDLVVTGRHAILIDLSELVKDKETTNEIQVIDGKGGLLAYKHKKTQVFEGCGYYTVYHLAVTRNNTRHGIYANGLLISSGNYKNINKHMTLVEI